jgi:hypothetical protein
MAFEPHASNVKTRNHGKPQQVLLPGRQAAVILFEDLLGDVFAFRANKLLNKLPHAIDCPYAAINWTRFREERLTAVFSAARVSVSSL